MHNITLRQLRSLLAIHETGKISSAASRLGLTGPAVTIQIRQIEEEVGTPLFDRMSDGMRPTVAGLAAIDAARAVLGRLDLLGEELAAITLTRAAGGPSRNLPETFAVLSARRRPRPAIVPR